MVPGMVTRTFDLSVWEAEAGRHCGATWAVEWNPISKIKKKTLHESLKELV